MIFNAALSTFPPFASHQVCPDIPDGRDAIGIDGGNPFWFAFRRRGLTADHGHIQSGQVSQQFRRGSFFGYIKYVDLVRIDRVKTCLPRCRPGWRPAGWKSPDTC